MWTGAAIVDLLASVIHGNIPRLVAVVALLGVIVLAVTSALGPGGSGQFGGALAPDAAEAVVAFRRAFFAVAGCLAISLVCLVMIEERPLRTSVMVESK